MPRKTIAQLKDHCETLEIELAKKENLLNEFVNLLEENQIKGNSTTVYVVTSGIHADTLGVFSTHGKAKEFTTEMANIYPSKLYESHLHVVDQPLTTIKS